jgi:hypothetical protein
MPITCLAFMVLPRSTVALRQQVILGDAVVFGLEIFAAGVWDRDHAYDVAPTICAPKGVS